MSITSRGLVIAAPGTAMMQPPGRSAVRARLAASVGGSASSAVAIALLRGCAHRSVQHQPVEPREQRFGVAGDGDQRAPVELRPGCAINRRIGRKRWHEGQRGKRVDARERGVGVLDAELGTEHGCARHDVVGWVVVEDRCRVEQRLAHGWREGEWQHAIALRGQQPHDIGHELGRLAELAVRRIELRRSARFRIKQDRPHGRFEVAAQSAAVVREYGGDAADIPWRRIASDEFLDQLLRNEWPGIGMDEDVANRKREILRHREVRRSDRSLGQRFRAEIVRPGALLHATVEVARIERARGHARCRRIRPASENSGECDDLLLLVRRDRPSLRVDERRAVRLQLHRAYREQLQQLASVVLVGLCAGRGVGLRVVRHVEIAAHRGRQRYLGQQLLEVIEREIGQQLLVALHRVRGPDLEAGRHQELRERERDPLPQLVGCGERVAEELPLRHE